MLYLTVSNVKKLITSSAQFDLQNQGNWYKTDNNTIIICLRGVKLFQSSDIHTVTEFSRKPAEHIKRLSESKRPEMLTVNGKPALVIQDAETYEKLAALADYAESIQSIRQAISEQGRPLGVFTAEFEAKHGIPR